MATGIVSHDFAVVGVSVVSWLLLLLAIVSYVVLLVLMIGRAVRCPMRILDDLANAQHGPGFLALVAATGIVASELAPINLQISTVLWPLEGILWLGLSYALFASVAAHRRKPEVTTELSGKWLLAVVATQSLAGLGVLVSAQFGDGQALVLFLSLCVFLSACVLYLAIIPLIVNRLEFLSLTPRAFTPDYWIDMGAMAITTLTGAQLISAAGQSPVLQQMGPFVLGLSLLFWAGASWWIPLLSLLEVWRHVLSRVRLDYKTDYWSLVFPVGMYAAGTFEIAALVHIGVLMILAELVGYVALGLWALAFVGMSRDLALKAGLARRAVQ
jgi:tellurite resistance protein TehA-like permease